MLGTRPRHPFLIAPSYTKQEIQDALDLDLGTPVVPCDARQRDSVKQVLVALVKHTIGTNRANRERAGAG